MARLTPRQREVLLGLVECGSNRSIGEDMVVGEANEWMAIFHDCMPVMLTGDEIENWLTGKAGKEVLRSAAESARREWVVSSRVNKTGAVDDGPTLVEPVAA